MNRTTKPTTRFRFRALDEALAVNAQLKDAHREIRRHDPDLAQQLRRAARSIALNLGEGSRRRGKDRTYHYRVAAGSANEVRVALELAKAWGETNDAQCAPCLETLDKLLAMLWRLTE